MQDPRDKSNARDLEVWIQESFDLDDWPPSPSGYVMVAVAVEGGEAAQRE